jgi:hypothetical protein
MRFSLQKADVFYWSPDRWNHIFLFVLLFRQKDQNHLPKRWLARSLKTQEILAKRWALLRTSPNGLWAVFAGFLSVFKFTGSTAPRLGGLTRCVGVA